MSAPPRFLRLAGHPVRWSLLRELAHSDRRVGELCALSGRPQSLVSYHLRALREGGVVSSHRSAADGRDSYYALDLRACAELIAATGAALHPGLVPPPGAGPIGAPARVLFLCTGNSARSQMAEALTRRLSGGSVEAASAGSHPKPLHAGAIDAMRARGIDISAQRSKPIAAVAHERFDRVVTLCDRVREVCPEFPGGPDAIHWSIPDPARAPDPGAALERVAEELYARIGFLLRALDHAATRPEVRPHA